MSTSTIINRIFILTFVLTAFCTCTVTALPFFFRPYFESLSATGVGGEGARVAMAPASPPPPKNSDAGGDPSAGNNKDVSVVNGTLNSVPPGAGNANYAMVNGFSSSFVFSAVVIGAVGVQLL